MWCPCILRHRHKCMWTSICGATQLPVARWPSVCTQRSRMVCGATSLSSTSRLRTRWRDLKRTRCAHALPARCEHTLTPTLARRACSQPIPCVAEVVNLFVLDCEAEGVAHFGPLPVTSSIVRISCFAEPWFTAVSREDLDLTTFGAWRESTCAFVAAADLDDGIDGGSVDGTSAPEEVPVLRAERAWRGTTPVSPSRWAWCSHVLCGTYGHDLAASAATAGPGGTYASTGTVNVDVYTSERVDVDLEDNAVGAVTDTGRGASL